MALVTRRNQSTFDIQTLASLSQSHDIVLIVSPRTHYLLCNLAEREIVDPRLYVQSETLAGRYFSVEPGTQGWDTYLETSVAAQLELMRMPIRVAGYQFVSLVQDGTDNASVGTNIFQLTPDVPATGLWELLGITLIRSAQNALVYAVWSGSAGSRIFLWEILASGNWLSFSPRLLANGGESVYVYFMSCSSGEDIYCRLQYAVLNDPSV